MKYQRIIVYSCVLALVLGVLGCASQGRLNYVTPQEAYERGMAEYERGRYDRAAQYFQGVFDFGRAVAVAADAQLMLARSYRGNREYIRAASEYSRFSDLYRTDPRRAEADFERAMTYFEQSPQFELDQTPTERAIDEFNLYMQRYPRHDSVDAATNYVGVLREKLAYKRYFNAQQYERRGLFEAAGLTYELVFDQYPETPLADDALLGALRSYISFSDQSIVQRQAERLQRALDHYERLTQIFPDSELLGAAEELYQRAVTRLSEIAPDAGGAS